MIIIDFDRSLCEKEYNDSKATLAQHYPYKSFKTYCDSQNFLLTNYRETDFYNCVAILESYDDTVVIAENCTCGYSGHGPHNTIDLLKLLRVSQQQACEYVLNNAVELYFDKSGNIIEDKTNLTGIFESRQQYLKFGQINIANITYANTSSRKMYLVNPTGDSLYTLLQLIKAMQPMSYNYYIGKNSNDYIDVSFVQSEIFGRNVSIDKMSFFSIIGTFFDVTVFYDYSYAHIYTNNILLALGESPAYQEFELLGLTVLAPSSYKIGSALDKMKAFIKMTHSKKEIQCGAVLESEAKHE